MSPARHLRTLLLMGALVSLASTALHAQYEVKTKVANNLSYRAGGIPTGFTGTPSGNPAITPQFANAVETSASAGPVPVTTANPAGYPSSAVAILRRASVGNAFSSGVPRYFLGERITVPATYVNTAGASITVPAASDFWRAEPVRAGEVVVNPSGQPLKDSTGVAIANTGNVIVPALDPGVYEHFYYSPHAKQVFASEPGQVTIWWRSRLPDASNNYILVREVFSVTSATAPGTQVRTLYWTEKSFDGPRIQIPGGRIVTVNAVYSNVFPKEVATEFIPIGGSGFSNTNPQLKTVWFDKTNGIGEIHAYNVTGRVMLEYLGALQQDGSHEFLGADIVSVAQAAPAGEPLPVNLGKELRPKDENLLLIAQPISNTSSSIAYYGTSTRPDGSLAYYAEHENYIEDQVVFYWLEQLDASILPPSGNQPGLKLNWPKYLHKYLLVWPSDLSQFAHYTVPHNGSTAANGLGLKFEGGKIPTVIFQDDLEQDEAVLDSTSQRLFVNFTKGLDQTSRILLKFTGDNGAVWYVPLMAQSDEIADDYLQGDGSPALTGSVFVGDRISRPSSAYSYAGYIAEGTAHLPAAYIDPFANGVAAAEQGAIIPVNALPNGATKLRVWWFKKVAAPSSDFADFYTPAKVGLYTVSYRTTETNRIILASNSGSGDLPAGQIAGTVYVQNDVNLPGYNPNEEHALLLGGRAYALRDDLNITTGASYATFTSLPRVLLQYTDPTDQRPAVAVYEVRREGDGFTFNYPVTAGTILNSPMPLPKLPLPVDATTGLTRNLEVASGTPETLASGAPVAYQKFTFKDRKGYDWVYRGPHASGSPALGMQWYYTMRAGFFIPGRTLAAQPAVGTILPYLRPTDAQGAYIGDPVTATPLTVVYRPVWPDNAPTMSVGETLTKANHGLPAVRGNTSAVVFYQQSIAQSGTAKPSVTLHDPTRAKTVLLDNASVGLVKLPASAATTAQSGKTYFQLLPPHLQQRFYFDGTLGPAGGLVLIGQFVDEIAGEKYVHLNALSPADVESLKAIVAGNDQDYQKWSIAIDNLATRVETFKEDPAKRGTYIPDSAKTVSVGGTALAVISSSDTAVDSYALTATGTGSGFATLIFGNGYAFTPVGDPVSVQIVKVVPQLYTGDLKALPASNPLDEQTTLRHSGDFAAHPENYDFEWAYSSPVDGVALPTYTFSMATVLGLAPSNLWQMVPNPSAPLPSTYPSTAYEFPHTLAINDSSASASSGLPGIVVQAVSRVHFATLVPAQIVFSATLGTHDGFVLYVNGTPALASRVPAGVAVPGNLTLTDARTGLLPTTPPAVTPLQNQYYVSPTYFAVGDNRIEVALYSTADAAATSSLNFRLDASSETDYVVTNAGWIKPNPPTPPFSNTLIVGGSATSPLGNPLLVFSDNYLTMRYRPKTVGGVTTNVAGTAWSRWMTPKLVESWIKRALDGINPFTQRTDDLYNNPVSTDVSILTQAGKRWEGDVALNLNNINDFGLIEIYETLLNRAKKLSIDAGFDDPGTNDTLLLTAGYLNDLYMTLGNEASDDADNPTIAIDGELSTGEVSTSRFSFEGQLPTLIDEELALLRGRDDFLSPDVTVAPAYNRLYWNFTNGINSGESIYAINYDIKEKSGSPTTNGTLDAADAQYMFPQGHGDAYGHYLTALTGYYKLLTSPHFTWTPRTEAVDVLGQTVQVDYQDERKFAAAAAAVARTAARVLDVTARKSYRDDPSVGWSHQHDGKEKKHSDGRLPTKRYWGTDEWAARGGQGAYFNWISANAMLPDKDNNPDHTGIQIIDRTTVPEIAEIVSSAVTIQTALDDQCAHLNPLGLAKGAIAFDISPTELKAGKSHFEQIYARALQASLNAKAAFDRACVMNRTLRNQNNTLDDYNNAVNDQERAFAYKLTTIYGTAYAGDIGPGKLYAQGYAGPDIYHYWLINQPSSFVDTTAKLTVSFHEPIEMNPFKSWSLDDVYNKVHDPLKYTDRTYTFSLNGLGQFAPSGMGSRAQPGTLQAALLDVYQAQVGARASANTLSSLMRQFDRDYQLFTEFRTAYDAANASAGKLQIAAQAASVAATILDFFAGEVEDHAATTKELSDALAECFPIVSGIDNDATSAARSALKAQATAASSAYAEYALYAKLTAAGLNMTADNLNGQADGIMGQYDWDNQDKQHVVEFERLLNQILATEYAIASRLADLQRANERVSQILAEGAHILDEREIFRQRAAAVIQGYRTRDLTYRAFRNEELSQYQSLYDLAAQYTYLAVQSYDYETGLLGTAAGQKVIDGVISTRSLGDFKDNMPVATTGTTGDSGLAGLLARLQSDWSVAKTRLGINNPDNYGTLFSLRSELFRVRTDATTTEDDKQWRQVLEQHIMSNVLNDPDVATYCRNIRKTDGTSVPGIVIPFATTIGQGLNFFGRPIAAGDHAYTASNFATKIYATGVVLDGYIGMDPYAIGTPNAGIPASSDPNALSATPYVYLIPAGQDSMFMPPLGDTAVVRSWNVKDQAMPLPFNLGQDVFSANVFFTPQGTVNEQFWITRKHQAFRPVNDPAYFYSTMPSEFTNSRLVGRSVWNSQWKLVIPANTLLNKEQDGLDKFVRTVRDIRIFLRTYSNSGN
jgi:hypothetical protein